MVHWVGKTSSYRAALELVASMATTRSANGNLIDDELHLFEKVDSEAVYILKLKKIWKGSSLYSQINITKKRDAYKTGADQHLAILMSSEWRSYWQTSNNLPPFLPTGSQLQMTILNLHISVINSFEKSEVHANNQSGKTLQEDHDFSTCSKFTQGSIMLRDRTWGPSINAKS